MLLVIHKRKSSFDAVDGQLSMTSVSIRIALGALIVDQLIDMVMQDLKLGVLLAFILIGILFGMSIQLCTIISENKLSESSKVFNFPKTLFRRVVE